MSLSISVQMDPIFTVDGVYRLRKLYAFDMAIQVGKLLADHTSGSAKLIFLNEVAITQVAARR